jgi:hypothetical protein
MCVVFSVSGARLPRDFRECIINQYAGIEHVTEISSDTTHHRCPECNDLVIEQRFDAAINHFLVQHGYRLLHFGTETWTDGGKLHQKTVALVGSPAE